MTQPEQPAASPSAPTPPRPPRARWSAALGFAASLLTIATGLGIAAMGMGFANATASGTGAAAVVLGIWMLTATRGVWQSRPITFIGLALGWGWLICRILLDLPATGASLVVALFLVPLITVPIGLAWLLLGLGVTVLYWIRTVKLLRRSLACDSAQPRIASGRNWVTLGLRLGLVVLVTFGAPRLVWLDRGTKIQRLAQTYAQTPSKSARRAAFGACTMVFLGYQLTDSGSSKKTTAARQQANEKALADARAEVASIVAAGAKYIRVGASGDQLLEAKPDQETQDDAFMATVRQTGLGLVLVDTQHPKVLRKRKLTWPEFCQFQHRRIEYYQRRYHPAVYMVVCEPMSYHGFGLTPETKFSAEAWAQQLSDMCRLVKSIDPGTRTGICLLVMKDREPEWQVWSQMKSLPDLDILSVEIYQPEDFPSTRQRLDTYGHPAQFNKSFWIAETYNGWALCPDRRWDQDAQWIALSADFAQVANAEAILVWTFGSFAPGGSFWDFMRPGRFRTRWGAGDRLSVVAREFARQAGPKL